MPQSKPKTVRKPSAKSATVTATGASRLKPTKTAIFLELLRSQNGVSINELQLATGWQTHSVRGFLSGTVKKRMGLVVASSVDEDGIRRYSLTENNAPVISG